MVETPDTEAMKDRERATWTAASPGWKTHDAVLAAFTRPVSEELLRRVHLSPGMRVLDLASGTGEPSLSAAERVGPTGSVLGTDLTDSMLVVARQKAADRGLRNIEYRVADVEHLDLPVGSFDAATMRFGIMFVPDPVKALRNIHRALRPGGAAALAVWGTPQENPIFRIPLEVLRRHTELPTPAPGAPGLFAFSDPQRLTQVLSEAGFQEVGSSPCPVQMADFRSGTEYWAFQRSVIGPIVRIYESLPPEVRRTVDAEVAEAAERHRGASGLVLPGMSYVGWGRR